MTPDGYQNPTASLDAIRFSGGVPRGIIEVPPSADQVLFRNCWIAMMRKRLAERLKSPEPGEDQEREQQKMDTRIPRRTSRRTSF